MPRCSREGCRNPVRLARQVGKHWNKPKRGERIIDGHSWRWFCSRQCVGKESGDRNAASGLLQRTLGVATERRMAYIARQRQAFFAREAVSLMAYGVSRDLAIATLDRVFRLGRKHGMDVLRRRCQKERCHAA